MTPQDNKALDNLMSLWMGHASEKYSDKVVELAYEPLNVGEIQDADGMGFVKGTCGDRMSIYLKLEAGFISDIKFLTDGCSATLACGSAITQMAKNRTPYEATKIYPQNIVRFLDGLPASHLHCAVLAVQALQKALESLSETREETDE